MSAQVRTRAAISRFLRHHPGAAPDWRPPGPSPLRAPAGTCGRMQAPRRGLRAIARSVSASTCMERKGRSPWKENLNA